MHTHTQVPVGWRSGRRERWCTESDALGARGCRASHERGAKEGVSVWPPSVSSSAGRASGEQRQKSHECVCAHSLTVQRAVACMPSHTTRVNTTRVNTNREGTHGAPPACPRHPSCMEPVCTHASQKAVNKRKQTARSHAMMHSVTQWRCPTLPAVGDGLQRAPTPGVSRGEGRAIEVVPSTSCEGVLCVVRVIPRRHRHARIQI
jgi:hypothetical protein